MDKHNYDVAAFIWPAYCDSMRSRIFWEKGMGEWQSVMSSKPKFEGHTEPRIPVWGYTNEADKYVMEMQINAALEHGVNVFIYDWYWYDKSPFLDECLNDGFLKASNNQKMKFYIMWANHDANVLWNKRLSSEMHNKFPVVWKGTVDFEEFKKIVEVWIEYFQYDNYYKINNCPVLNLYDIINFVKGLGGIENTKFAIDYLRKRTRDAGFSNVHLQVCFRKNIHLDISGVDSSSQCDEIEDNIDWINDLGFDSVTSYQYVHYGMVDFDYLKTSEFVFEESNKVRKKLNCPFFPHVSIGWDNNARYDKRLTSIMNGSTPTNFEIALKKAKDWCNDYLGETKLVTINSWNEWTEGSYLEPDKLNGYGYLEAVKRVFLDKK